MKLFGSDTNSGIIWKISNWFGMNFNQKLSSSSRQYSLVFDQKGLNFFIMILFKKKEFKNEISDLKSQNF